MRNNHGLILGLMLILLGLIPVVYLKWHATLPRPFSNIPITLYSKEDGKVYRLDLEKYLIGVVAAEMPAEFSMEALKAQSVAARTVAIQRLPRFGGRGCRHYRGADFCDDPAESQAWLSEVNLRRKWGVVSFSKYYRKVEAAVIQTAGEIMTYNNRPIDAVFHSTCGVGTAAASEVWHYNVPYLQSESCGYDLRSTRLRNSFIFSWNQLTGLLKIPAATIQKIRVTRRSATGRVLWLTMGDYGMSGEDFRKTVGLTSTCFTWKMTSAGIYFTAIGYGHGVGMCQYGANGMALQGLKYRRILGHYYRGIRLCKIKYK